MKIILLFCVLVPSFAQADYLLQAGGFYESSTDFYANGSPATITRIPLDVHAAHLSKEWVVGATYDSESKTTSGGGSSVKESRTAIGPTLGYTSRKDMGFYAMATYFISANYKSSDTSYSGSGFQLELGYRIMLKHFGLGLQGTYRSFTYKQTDDKQISLTQTRIDPGLFLLFEF